MEGYILPLWATVPLLVLDVIMAAIILLARMPTPLGFLMCLTFPVSFYIFGGTIHAFSLGVLFTSWAAVPFFFFLGHDPDSGLDLSTFGLCVAIFGSFLSLLLFTGLTATTTHDSRFQRLSEAGTLKEKAEIYFSLYPVETYKDGTESQSILCKDSMAYTTGWGYDEHQVFGQDGKPMTCEQAYILRMTEKHRRRLEK